MVVVETCLMAVLSSLRPEKPEELQTQRTTLKYTAPSYGTQPNPQDGSDAARLAVGAVSERRLVIAIDSCGHRPPLQQVTRDRDIRVFGERGWGHPRYSLKTQ